jgi:hypothetical protein
VVFVRFPAALAVLGIGAGLVGCGPSFQAVYEGNRRFEHCYALEENPTAPMPEKSTCWRDWSEHYTFGQTRDRVQYAISRYVALSRAGSAPTDEALMMAAPGETPRTSIINAPAPTNAFAPPPKVLEAGEERRTVTSGHPGEAANVPFIDAGAPAPVPTVVLPSQVCNDKCGGDYKTCAGSCEGDAGPKAKACVACESKYKTCMRGCFK